MNGGRPATLLRSDPVSRIRQGLGQLLVPGPCCICDEPLRDPLRGPVCADCRTRLIVPSRFAACPRCADFRVPEMCGRCRNDPPPWVRAVAAAPYEGRVRRAVVELKYRRREPIAALLAAAAATTWEMVFRNPAAEDPTTEPDAEDALVAEPGLPPEAERPPVAVIPMPAPMWRRIRRGFNPAQSIAEGVAERLRLPIEASVLRRRHSPPQTTVTPARRRRNVRGVFRTRTLAPSLVGRPLLLVDDVLTTGSTAGAATRAILAAGAGPVSVLTFARGGTPGV